MVAGHRNAGRVNLGVAGVGERRALLVGPPDGRGVAALGVGRQVEDRAIAAGRQDDGVGDVRFDRAGLQVAGDDASRLAVDHDQFLHLVPREHLDRAQAHLALQGLVGAQQKLLAGLAAGVEGPRDLGAAERPVRQQAAVFAGERHSLGNALVDDVDRDLGKAVDVGLAGPEVSPLDGVVEQPEDAVAVVLIILGRVDPTLGGDRVGSPRAVLVAEAGNLVAQFRQRGGRRAARQARADDDDGVLPLVRRVDQLHVELVFRPLLLDRARWYVRLEFHGALLIHRFRVI